MSLTTSKSSLPAEDSVKHPVQPIVLVDSVARFKSNKIIRALLDTHPSMNLNKISMDQQNGKYSLDDYSQLMQLIGYSVCGYAELETADTDIADAAWEAMQAARAPV